MLVSSIFFLGTVCFQRERKKDTNQIVHSARLSSNEFSNTAGRSSSCPSLSFLDPIYFTLHRSCTSILNRIMNGVYLKIRKVAFRIQIAEHISQFQSAVCFCPASTSIKSSKYHDLPKNGISSSRVFILLVITYLRISYSRYADGI